MRQPEGESPTRSLVEDIEDVTKSSDFYVTTDDFGREVPGPGSLDTFMVVADADAFGVRVETEDTTLVDEDFTTLSNFSDHLDHVSASTSGSDRVVSVTDFPFRGRVRCQVTVTDEVTFSWVRMVATLGRESDY